jgi:nucleoside-diphosphate-sugar epimerase
MYGEQEVFPTPETAPINPMSPYGLTKYEGELYAKLYEKLYGLEVNSIRPFNVYGSRQNPDSPYSAAAPKFLKELQRGETPWITGDGCQSRDFIYVSDVVEIMYRASKCKEYGEAFNAGSGTNISINHLYDIVCKIMGKFVEPDYVAKVIEPDVTLADMSKVKRILKFEPKVGLEEGLKQTV